MCVRVCVRAFVCLLCYKKFKNMGAAQTNLACHTQWTWVEVLKQNDNNSVIYLP